MGEVPLPTGTVSWRKSRRSGETNCLEVAQTRERVWVRDSKKPSGLVLGCAPPEWAAFVSGVQCDEFGPLDEPM